MPIIQGEVTKVLNRFHGEESVGVLLEVNIQGHKAIATAYESDFPVGLLVEDGPLAGKTVDIIIHPPIGEQLTHSFVVANWSNQSDSIKAKLVTTVLQGLSRAHLESVPWQEQVMDPIKNNLEEIYKIDSEGKSKGSKDLPKYQVEKVQEDDLEEGESDEDDSDKET